MKQKWNPQMRENRSVLSGNTTWLACQLYSIYSRLDIFIYISPYSLFVVARLEISVILSFIQGHPSRLQGQELLIIIIIQPRAFLSDENFKSQTQKKKLTARLELKTEPNNNKNPYK